MSLFEYSENENETKMKYLAIIYFECGTFSAKKDTLSAI